MRRVRPVLRRFRFAEIRPRYLLGLPQFAATDAPSALAVVGGEALRRLAGVARELRGARVGGFGLLGGEPL